MRRRDHMIGRGKIEIARGHLDDVAAAGAQLAGLAAQDGGRRRQNAADARR
jgi:hypothetical protein